MKKKPSLFQDYAEYREIMDDLHQPIKMEGLDSQTIKELYVSKLVYLENLRVTCFTEMNKTEGSCFRTEDYQFIIEAIEKTKVYLRETILFALHSSLSRPRRNKILP